MKSIRIAAILVALVTTACSAGTVSPSAVASSPSAATASPTATPTAPPTATTPSLLEGIWTTAEITCDQQLATIHKAGFTDAQITAANWACSQPVHYRIRFLADQLAVFVKQGEGAWELVVGGSFKVIDDHTIVETDATLSFTLVGNALTFVSARTTGDLDGQVHAAAFFLAAPFTKEP
jgi:hypothetical protein